jgi:hypothetical protein
VSAEFWAIIGVGITVLVTVGAGWREGTRRFDEFARHVDSRFDEVNRRIDDLAQRVRGWRAGSTKCVPGRLTS